MLLYCTLLFRECEIPDNIRVHSVIPSFSVGTDIVIFAVEELCTRSSATAIAAARLSYIVTKSTICRVISKA